MWCFIWAGDDGFRELLQRRLLGGTSGHDSLADYDFEYDGLVHRDGRIWMHGRMASVLDHSEAMKGSGASLTTLSAREQRGSSHRSYLEFSYD